VKLGLSYVREEHRMRVFENRGVKRIFGPKRAEVVEEWKKLHDEELRNVYVSPNMFRVIK